MIVICTAGKKMLRSENGKFRGGEFWIAQVPFAFDFECDLPYGNLATVCNWITFKPMALPWQELRNCHSAIRQTFPEADKRNLRYFKITRGVFFITPLFLIEFTALFTKPPDCLPPAGIPSRDHSPIHGVRGFDDRDPEEPDFSLSVRSPVDPQWILHC